MHKMTFQSDAARRRIDKIQQLLRATDMPITEVAEQIHLTLYWARAYMRHLHERQLVHIVSYRKQRRLEYDCHVALYCWGAGIDAEKPEPASPAEQQRDRRAKLAADKDAHEKSLALRRAKKIKPARDWAAAWIPTKTQGAV